MRRIHVLLGVLLMAALISCEKENTSVVDKSSESDLPQTFKVDIPSSLSQANGKKSALNSGISGNEVYLHLNNFIYVGEAAADLVQDIIRGIRIYGLNKPMSFTFTSNEDGKNKNVVVSDDVVFENTTWDHHLIITDADSEVNNDGGKALLVYWNASPVKGVAVLKPKNWNTDSDENFGDVVFKVSYDESGTLGYDNSMEVSIFGWEEAYADRFRMDNLKMFVGKTGDVLSVYGNSNHPEAWLFVDSQIGFNWAFVASANQTENIAVAEVGLPPCVLNENSRKVLLGDYSIRNVFTSQIREYVYQQMGYYPDSATVASYLLNTEAPAFFGANGFIQGGEVPNSNYNILVNTIQTLSPFNPKEINAMVYSFE